ncbi:L-arabinokinase [Vitis vinifera]|uniref:L-arabinokinase n=1 Tax=Vitis vinifera TaxID=29760 RepID=A0A438DG65_VITVI|nr:L-arabinokinase [Vitis vinifera]
MAMMKKKGDRLVFAYYVTGHGFGHATRVVEVVRHLIVAGHDVHVVTAAPDFVFTSEIQSPRLFIRKVLLDCGAVQADALTVDPLASLEMYSKTAVLPRASILATEVEWLKSIEADLVVSDVVPVVCQAAANAGISSVCVSNFSWDFIYAEYVMAAGYDHRFNCLAGDLYLFPSYMDDEIAQDYSHCKFLIRLPGYCPMPAFRAVIDVPLVVRRLHKSRAEVRKELGIADGVKLVIFNFGGQSVQQLIKTYIKGKEKLSHLIGPVVGKDDPWFVMWDEEDSQIMSWLWNSMQPEISRTCMFLSRAKEIWESVYHTYSKVRDATQMFELRQGFTVPKQSILSITEYCNVIRSLWLGLDQYQNLRMQCSIAATIHQEFIE